MADPVSVYTTGKSFLELARRIWKREIKPRLGAHTYKYVGHTTGHFSLKTGQWFNTDNSVLNYLRSIGVSGARVPSDGLVYLPDSKTFNGYTFINGALWDRNVYPWGVPIMSDQATTTVRYTEAPQKPPSPPTGDKKLPGQPVGSTPAKSPIPILGLIGLAYTVLKK